jgi:hypothetical protein
MSDRNEFAGTRRALHGIAELVLAGPQHRLNGRIRLRVTPGGFGTAFEPDLRVDGAHLVAGGQRLPANGKTYAELAAAAGVEARAPTEVYSDGPGIGLDEVITVDADAAAHLADCFALGQEALMRFLPRAEIVLWPEHFDLGATADEVNYGISPGDSYLGEPYAYVGPWKVPEGDFWNAPFGAARAIQELGDAEAILAFFEQGHRQVSR